ncbi:MAG: thioredoxin family protein [Desulfatiglandales bacterium]
MGASEEILTGRLSLERLYKEVPVFEENARTYAPQAGPLERIRAIGEETDLILFIGTWCPDSRSEAPKLLKILAMADNPNLALTIMGVDRDKDDGEGLARAHKIERVPTAVFIRGGRELGRIVEHPKRSPEEDLLEIVTGS